MANGINDRGVIVGFASRGNTPEHAVIFRGPNDFTELPSLGLSESWAEDVNNAGDIVGSAFDASIGFRPFLYRNGQMLDLTRLLPEGSGWDELVYANNINDNGVIVGTGRYRGVFTGFVMSEVPEPAAGGYLAAAAIFLRRGARRRRTP